MKNGQLDIVGPEKFDLKWLKWRKLPQIPAILLTEMDFFTGQDSPNIVQAIGLLIGGIPTPLKNMKVSWDYCSQYVESHKIHVPNHQPDYYFSIHLVSICPIHVAIGIFFSPHDPDDSRHLVVLQLERRRPTTFGPVSKAATPQGHRGELQGFLGPNTCVHTLPIGSMYAIYGNIYH